MNLPDRMKRYERVTQQVLSIRTPVVVRVDGRAFHTLTGGMKKPFDPGFMDAMLGAAVYVAQKMQGFQVAYIQSDEVSFGLVDYENLESEGWFGYNVSKLVSVSASLMSVRFSELMDTEAVFDSRAFNVPHSEVANYFLWRARDWNRNSLQMYCRSVFSHKELHGKDRDEMHEMLHSCGKNWALDLSGREKNGVFVVSFPDGPFAFRDDVGPDYASVSGVVSSLFEYPDGE